MTDSLQGNRMCYQHDTPIPVYKGFKVKVTIRGKEGTRYCCEPECVESLRQSAEVISVEPFAVNKETKQERDKRWRQEHKPQRAAYQKKYYNENYVSISDKHKKRYKTKKGNT